MHVCTTIFPARPVGALQVAALLHSLPEYPGLHVAVVHTALDEQEVHVPFEILGHTASQPSSLRSSLASKKLLSHVTAVQTALDEQAVHVPFEILGHPASQPSLGSLLSSNVFAAQAVPPHVLEF